MRLRQGTGRVGVAVAALLVISAACDSGGRDDGDGASSASNSAEESDAAIAEFGTIDFPCGPNEGGGELPADEPSETFGVSPDGINIGTFADPGYEAAPGLEQEFFDASEVFVAECNAAGGINGKPIILHERDAKVFEYVPRVEESCAEDFAVVGGGAVLDDTGAQLLTDCGMPSFPIANATAKAALADNVVQAVPNAPYAKPASHFVKFIDELDDDGAGTGLETDDVIQHAGILYGDLQTTIDIADQLRKTLEPLGFEFVYDATYNLAGEANWAPFAQAIADAGVEFFAFVGDGSYLGQLQAAMDQVETAPAVIMLEANFYDFQYAAEIEGLTPDTLTLVRSAVWPLGLARDNPATQTYLDLFAKHLPDVDPSAIGLGSTTAWLLFAQAASECDRADDLTRTCVFDTAKAVAEWTGGGLHAPTNPRDVLPPSCMLLLEVTGGTFELWRPEGETPEDAYFCPEENAVIEFEGNYGEGAVRAGG